MVLFFSDEQDSSLVYLPQEESQHCVKVLRHRRGDEICVIDGKGSLYRCILEDDSIKRASARIVGVESPWGGHPYTLTMGVCPTKNNDRFEWFMEKACEMGLDRIVPLFGDHSERKVYKTDRARKILVSAAKQSLKASVPSIDEAESVSSFIRECKSPVRLMACCFEDADHPRRSVTEVLSPLPTGSDIAILIGPEGDFSNEEAALALENGFIPVHFGDSRLRTETAALTAVAAVYLNFIK